MCLKIKMEKLSDGHVRVKVHVLHAQEPQIFVNLANLATLSTELNADKIST